MPRVLIAAVAVVLAIVVPTASVGAEDLASTNQRLLAALALVGQNSYTSDLPAVLDRNQVRVRFVRMNAGVYARYSVARHAIEIDERWANADTTTLAAVIAHEATHAEDAVNGDLASGASSACIDSEIRAFRRSALFWIGEFGSRGKIFPHDDLDVQLNLIAERQVHDPAGLEDLVRSTYSSQCAH